MTTGLRRRILFVSHSAQLLGAEQSLLALVDHALGRGLEVAVVLPSSGPLERELEARGVLIHKSPNHWWMSRRGGGLIGLGRTLAAGLDVVPMAAQIRAARPDVVVVNSAVVPAAMIAARLLSVPTIVVVRESIRSNPTLRSVVPKSIVARTIDACASQVIAVSRFARSEYGLPAVVVHPEVSLEPRATSGTTNHGRVALRALLVGSSGGDKGQLDALAAAAIVRAAGGDVSLEFCGVARGRATERLLQAATAHGLSDRVTIVPPTRHVADHFAGADVTLMLSRHEAYGRVTAESLLCGVPVVGYALGATPEVLADGGGVLVEPEPRRVAEALLTLQEPESLRALAQQAERAGARLRSTNHASEFFDVVDEVIR